ncbi:hypothetical protein HPP92_024472 [Vanilla planifolia]|uniref:Uncharacterized protein n=1 Tax=Vanilla planifolia TaxID=51239 RepID=A0A835UBD1_VANPL|nr:hypothetical protein HPP92_024472 [Vanilla planifolia]
METAAVLGFTHVLSKAVDFVPRMAVLAAHQSNGKSLHSDGCLKGRFSISGVVPRERRMVISSCKRMGSIRASLNASSRPSESSSQVAPLQLESPVGQVLAQILLSHPHLLPAAVDQQLDQLVTDLEIEKKQEEPGSTGMELSLYRRIAELKAKERKQALEEILYALVVQRFVEADVSLVPSVSRPSNDRNKVDHWPSWEEKFQKLHSSEAYEMILNHLLVILGNRMDDSSSIASISKLRIGQVYAASILYGYFLKRVDKRFQLEKSMKTLPWGPEDEASAIQQATKSSIHSNSHPKPSSWPASTSVPGGFTDRIKPCRLRTYVMSLDSEILQRFASVRSREAYSIVEKHTEALFGKLEVAVSPQGTVDPSKDDIIKVTIAGLKRLILEAVTFGSFLWEVESYVDSRYHFVAN